MTISIKFALLRQIYIYNRVLHTMLSPRFLPSADEHQERLPQGSQVSTEARKISISRPGEECPCVHMYACACVQMGVRIGVGGA